MPPRTLSVPLCSGSVALCGRRLRTSSGAPAIVALVGTIDEEIEVINVLRQLVMVPHSLSLGLWLPKCMYTTYCLVYCL